jgi:hypothetical protein
MTVSDEKRYLISFRTLTGMHSILRKITAKDDKEALEILEESDLKKTRCNVALYRVVWTDEDEE